MTVFICSALGGAIVDHVAQVLRDNALTPVETIEEANAVFVLDGAERIDDLKRAYQLKKPCFKTLYELKEYAKNDRRL